LKYKSNEKTIAVFVFAEKLLNSKRIHTKKEKPPQLRSGLVRIYR
jgi:hypothetical protein